MHYRSWNNWVSHFSDSLDLHVGLGSERLRLLSIYMLPPVKSVPCWRLPLKRGLRLPSAGGVFLKKQPCTCILARAGRRASPWGADSFLDLALRGRLLPLGCHTVSHLHTHPSIQPVPVLQTQQSQLLGSRSKTHWAQEGWEQTQGLVSTEQIVLPFPSNSINIAHFTTKLRLRIFFPEGKRGSTGLSL